MHLHGRDSRLIADFNSLGSILTFRRAVPDLHGRDVELKSRLSEHLNLVVRVRKRRVATVMSKDGRLAIQRHWPSILLSLLPHWGRDEDV